MLNGQLQGASHDLDVIVHGLFYTTVETEELKPLTASMNTS